MVMENAIVQLGAGGIFVFVMMRMILDFLGNQKAKKAAASDEPAESHEAMKVLTELHDAIMAPPPRTSLVSVVSDLQRDVQCQVREQKESVKILEEIRDVLKSQSAKLEDAKCLVTEAEKKI